MAKARARDSRLEVGRRLPVKFGGLAVDGAALARVGQATLAVRYAIPGEEALVEVVRTGPALAGNIVTLQRTSPDAAVPLCLHFGRCGGCQLQHIGIAGQRRFKTAMVAATLKPAGVPAQAIRPCTGGEAWGYRSMLRATFDRRGDVTIAGFFGWGDPHIINVEACPTQHPTNVRILKVVREAVRTLGLAPYDRRSGRGMVRGVLGMTGYVTGEAVAVLSGATPVPDRMAFVRAVLDRVPGLVGLLQTVQPGRSTAFFGRNVGVLWGRAYIEDEILGLRLRFSPKSVVLPNPGSVATLAEAIVAAGELRGDEQVFDAYAEAAVLPLVLAPRVRRIVGVVPDRETMEEAWAAAARNGIANAVFYTRDPARVLLKLHGRGERSDVLLAGPPGEGLPRALLDALATAGPRRMVYVGRSPTVAARDLVRLQRVGFTVQSVQPVDLFPQTSHVHAVVALRRG